MRLTREDILRIASLAHLRLTEDEIETFSAQLSSVLDYVGQLSRVDVTGCEPVGHITGVSNMLRPDEVRSSTSETRTALLAAAPARDGGRIKVKAVFQ